MNISRLLKICAFCCIGLSNCNAVDINVEWNNIVNNIIHINDVKLVDGIISEKGYSYTNIEINNNMFKHSAVLYNNDTYCYVDKNSVDINRRKGYIHDSDDVKTALGNLYLERFNALEQALGKDFITYIEEDVKEIFGNNYKVYFNYKNMEYNGQQIDESGHADYFDGTFEELMKVNNSQLITTIHRDLQFMSNTWSSWNRNSKHLVITDNNVTYYFDINNNTISIYLKPGHQESGPRSENAYTTFIERVQERWNREQNEIRNIFGNDHRIYYDDVDSVNDPNEDSYDSDIESDNMDIEDDNVI